MCLSDPAQAQDAPRPIGEPPVRRANIIENIIERDRVFSFVTQSPNPDIREEFFCLPPAQQLGRIISAVSERSNISAEIHVRADISRNCIAVRVVMPSANRVCFDEPRVSRGLFPSFFISEVCQQVPSVVRVRVIYEAIGTFVYIHYGAPDASLERARAAALDLNRALSSVGLLTYEPSQQEYAGRRRALESPRVVTYYWSDDEQVARLVAEEANRWLIRSELGGPEFILFPQTDLDENNKGPRRTVSVELYVGSQQ
jgi:hypothetical protein